MLDFYLCFNLQKEFSFENSLDVRQTESVVVFSVRKFHKKFSSPSSVHQINANTHQYLFFAEVFVICLRFKICTFYLIELCGCKFYLYYFGNKSSRLCKTLCELKGVFRGQSPLNVPFWYFFFTRRKSTETRPDGLPSVSGFRKHKAFGAPWTSHYTVYLKFTTLNFSPLLTNLKICCILFVRIGNKILYCFRKGRLL